MFNAFIEKIDNMQDQMVILAEIRTLKKKSNEGITNEKP